MRAVIQVETSYLKPSHNIMTIISLKNSFPRPRNKNLQKYIYINGASLCIFYKDFGESMVVDFIWNVRMNITYQMVAGKHYLRYWTNSMIEQNQLLCLWWTLSWRRPLSYRNQSIDLLSWFLYDNGLRHERVKSENKRMTIN